MKSREKVIIWDSCYCLDVAFFVEINRYKSIKVKYRNEKGELLEEKFDDNLSELVQHEIDHLNGIHCTDYLSDGKSIMMREKWEKKIR